MTDPTFATRAELEAWLDRSRKAFQRIANRGDATGATKAHETIARVLSAHAHLGEG